LIIDCEYNETFSLAISSNMARQTVGWSAVELRLRGWYDVEQVVWHRRRHLVSPAAV
jgi:hypothetical protein